MFGCPDLPKFKAAAVQASPVVKDAPIWFDLKATTDKAISLIEEAGRKDARLIVFPECWMPCHPYWSIDFADRPTFREIWTKYLWSSIEVPGPVTEALAAAAKKTKAYVVMGINERDTKYHGRMYNSILYLGPDGSIIGTHRKICNTISERLFHTPGDGGDNLKTVFKTDIGIIGGSICGEHHQLLLTYNWIMQGIQVHCSLWPGHKTLTKIADISTRALSISSHCYSVSAATFIEEANRPRNFYRNSAFNDPGWLGGGSMIVDPLGEYVAGPVFDEETIVYGEIDLSKVDKSLMGTNLTGSYSRWDLININVREQPYEPVMSLENSGLALSDIGSGPDQLRYLESKLTQLERQIAALMSEAK